MKSPQILARVLGRGLTIDPVPCSHVKFRTPFWLTTGINTLEKKSQKTKHTPQNTQNMLIETLSKMAKEFFTPARTLPAFIGVMVCLHLSPRFGRVNHCLLSRNPADIP
jgi:hypothetical protein